MSNFPSIYTTDPTSPTAGLPYFFRWQTPVCAIIFIIPSLISIRYISRFSNDDHLKSTHLWMPCWKNLNPLWLLVFRVFALVSMSFVLYEMVAAAGVFAFYFYTQWTFTLVIIYFALGTYTSAREWWTHSKTANLPRERERILKKDSDSTTAFQEEENSGYVKVYDQQTPKQLNQRAGFLENAMQNIYQTCAGATMLTDLVFWCLLVPVFLGDEFALTLVIGLMHSLNAIFLLLDTALNSLPFTWYRLPYFVLWSSAYVVFQWFMHALGFTWWPYPFFELATPWAPLWYIALALVHLPCFGIYALVVKVKFSLLSTFFSNECTRL